MICPACNYAMDAFDVSCPRCQGKGAAASAPPKQPQSATIPSPSPSPSPPQVSTAPTPAPDPEASKKAGMCCGLGCGLPLLGLILLMIIGAIKGPSDASPTLGYFYAKEAITRQLKAPTTAVFPASHERGVVLNEVGDELIVAGFVDAQNSFGATIRSRWYARLKRSADRKSWIVLEAKLVE